MTSSVLILGASSDIARAIGHKYAASGAALILAGRDPKALELDAEDFRIRYRVEVQVVGFDVLDTAGHAAFLDRLEMLPDTVICVVGLLGDQAQSEQGFVAADLVLRSNFNGPVSILGEAANRMTARGSGTIIGISSVAGDRGRKKNYVYGSAKAGFTAFLSGLRGRLEPTGVRVITVKPGFCRTKMTAGMPLPKPLTAEPAQVAEAVFQAQAKGRDEIYVLAIWRLVMFVICHVPERVFKKMSF